MKTKRFMCATCFALVLMLSILQSATAAEERFLSSGIAYKDIGRKIEEFVAENRDATVGAAIGVFDREGSVYEGYFGYANREDEINVNAQTVMEWGSVTKLTIWISAMQLWEQGKLDLNENVQVYLPEGFLKNQRYEKPITMQNLMNHTPGYEELVFGMNADNEKSILPLEEALSRYQPYQRFEPGVVQAYSNYGAALAGFIVECVSGQPYYKYVKEHIFDPLGMKHTAILPDLSDNSWVQLRREQLHCYREDGSYITDGREWLNIYPCGMCTSTLSDLMKLGQALLVSNSQLFKSPSTYEKLFTPSAYYGDTDIPSNCHGFWTVYGRADVLSHEGNTKGCSSALCLDLRNGSGMAIMTNQHEEVIYNYTLPDLVFFSKEYQENKELYNPYDSGFVETGRNIWTGPLKLYRLFNIVSLKDITGLVTETESLGVHRYSCTGGDLLPISVISMVLMNASVILWALVSFFSLVWLFVRVVQRLRHRGKFILEVWEIFCCVIQLPFPLLMLPLAQSLMSMEWWPMWCYRLIFISAFIVLLTMIALFTFRIVNRKKDSLEKKHRILHVILLISLVISIGNIIYWNLFVFWMIP